MFQRFSPAQKDFGLADDEVIRHLMLQSGVYRPLSRKDVQLEFDDIDSPQITKTVDECASLQLSSSSFSEFKKGLVMYEQGDYVNAYKLFEELGDKGHIAGLYYQAIMSYDGKGTEEDACKGFTLMQKVYELSLHSPLDMEFRHLACYHLGNACVQGYGTTRSDEIAICWWQKAANEILFNPHTNVESQLSTDAGILCQTALGSFYSRCGKPEGADYTKAFYWHSEAARNGAIASIAQLGIFYLYGLGCMQNDTPAHEYLLLASTNHHTAAIGHLALYYLEKNMTESAHSWALRAITSMGNVRELDAVKLEQVVRELTPPNSHNQDEENTKRSLAMALFLLGYLHETGKGGTVKGRITPVDFYKAASTVDTDAVLFLGSRLKTGKHK